MNEIISQYEQIISTQQQIITQLATKEITNTLVPLFEVKNKLVEEYLTNVANEEPIEETTVGEE